MRHKYTPIIKGRSFDLLPLGVALLLLSATEPAWARAQDATLAIGALFPRTDEVAGWTLKQEPRFYKGNQVFDYMDGAGEIPRSYDLIELGSAKYTRGNVVLEVVIFDMGRSENAFGYYSARAFLEHNPYSKESVVALDHPAYVYSSVGILTMWKGKYTVIVQPDIGKPTVPDLIGFGRNISAKIGDKGRMPDLLSRLPKTGAGINYVRYLRGKTAFDTLLMFTPRDAFGGAKGADAAACEYAAPASVYTLCVVRYDSATGAQQALANLRQYLLSRKAMITASRYSGALVATVPRLNGIGAIVIGRYLGVVVGANDTRTVDAGLNRIRTSVQSH